MAEEPSARDRLAALLRCEPPESVSALPDDVLDRLIDQIEDGRRTHLRIADDAVNTALKSVPLPVRGIVKKALT